jgi:TrmH family RNA methyltransferase
MLPPAITSVRNLRFAAFLALRTREERASRGVFLLEGAKLTEEALTSGRAQCVLVDAERIESFGRLIELALSRNVEIAPLAGSLVAKLSQTPSPQGVLVVASLPDAPAPRQLGARIVALDGVQDPGNVGTIIRTADAAGLTGALLTPACADPYSVKSIRATMGSIFRVPIRVDSRAADIIKDIKAAGARVLVSSARGVPYYNISIREPWILIIGSEGCGVSDELRDIATDTIALPMRGGAESLNAAVAAGVLMYALTQSE